MSTGDLIRAARKKAGFTQKQLGELCGIAEPTIRRYELGKLNPKRETLQKIAKPLGVRWYELYSDDIDDQIDMIREEIENDKDSTGGSSEFVMLFTHPVVQDLAKALVRRNYELANINAEKEGSQTWNPTEKDIVLDAKWRIVEVLLENKIYPASYKSLIEIGFTKGDAFYVMKNSESETCDEELTEEQIIQDEKIASLIDFEDRINEYLLSKKAKGTDQA